MQSITKTLRSVGEHGFATMVQKLSATPIGCRMRRRRKRLAEFSLSNPVKALRSERPMRSPSRAATATMTSPTPTMQSAMTTATIRWNYWNGWPPRCARAIRA